MDVIAQKETIYVLNKTNSYFSDANLNTYLDMCYMSIYDDNGNIFSRAYYDSESNLINKNLYTFDDERLTSLSNYYDYDGLEILSYKNEYFYGEIILFSGVPDKIVSSLTKNMEGLYKLITIEGNSGGTNFVQEQYRTINVGGIIRGTKHRVVNCVVPDFNNTVEETTNNEKNNYRQNL